MMEWMVLLFATSKEYDKVLFTPHNWLSSLNNCHRHEISLFFVLPIYVVMKVVALSYCDETLQNPWYGL